MFFSSKKDQAQISVARHYYSPEDCFIFEKSLDIYKPAVQNPALPIVLLTVGSGWMGHLPIVYRVTSWWNSGGPSNICALGTVCVCIRHRGAFFQVPNWCTTASVMSIVSAVTAAALGWRSTAVAVACMVVSRAFLVLAKQGSAQLEDMVLDVAEALNWVKYNQHELVVSSSAPLPPMIFGGYSSGGHVAATLASRSDLWKQYEAMFAGILIISGVLAVQPIDVDGTSIQNESSWHSRVMKLNWSSTSSNRKSIDRSVKNSSVTKDDSSDDDALLHVGQNKPRWLTDTIMASIWGDSWTEQIPSPVQEKPPTLPHLLVGNHREVFGLPWLDIFFCSEQYHNILLASGVPSVYRQVDSDHWNILASRSLKETLRDELPKLVKTFSS